MKETTSYPKYALSLFSSAGIGELGLKACGIDILLSNELLKERCSLYHENYPNTESICGDIWDLQDVIEKKWKDKNVGNPFIIYATPPCQGMSFNGIGKILSEIRNGRRPKEDFRNRLIIPAVNIIKHLKPQWVILENVPTMTNTVIRTEDNRYINIIDFIKEQLFDEYVGKAEVINCANYGIPQSRIRLITILTRSINGKKYFSKYHSFMPTQTHSEDAKPGTFKWVTLKDAIGNLPKLSAQKGHNKDKQIKWHMVPLLNEEKYWWISCTPANETAYNNQCVKCGFQNNPKHNSCMVDGHHVSKKDTPIYCEKCGALLPRPTIIDKLTGKRRLIKGFDTAYKRMSWTMPAPTLTQNFQFVSSDKKIHPDQNRVLSIYEGLRLQSITDYDYSFSIDGKDISMARCCEIIGESVPPKLIELICRNIIHIENK